MPLAGKSPVPMVTISHTGIVSFNEAARREYLQQAKWVEFWWNPTTREMGITPCQQPSEGSKRLRFRRTGAGALAKDVLRWAFGAVPLQTKRYRAKGDRVLGPDGDPLPPCTVIIAVDNGEPRTRHRQRAGVEG